MTTGEIPNLSTNTERAQPRTGRRRAPVAPGIGLKLRNNPRAITTAERLISLVRDQEDTP